MKTIGRATLFGFWDKPGVNTGMSHEEQSEVLAIQWESAGRAAVVRFLEIAKERGMEMKPTETALVIYHLPQDLDKLLKEEK
jgi:hypothetical protein